MKLFSSMSCPYKMTGPLSKPLQMGVCSYFLASHASKGLAPDCAGYFLPSIYYFFLFPHHAPTQWEVPVETAIKWFGVLLFPVHSWRKPQREVIKRKFESKVILIVFVWCFYSHVPHHAPAKWQVSCQAPTRCVGVVVIFLFLKDAT